MSNLPVVAGRNREVGNLVQMVGFKVGGEEYCVEILKVQEIIRLVPITVMPNAPEHVEGVINLRGRIIPILDFGKRFRIYGEGAKAARSKRIIVVTMGAATVGLIVDSVSQVLKLSPEQIAPAPSVTKGFDTEAIIGVGKLDERLVIVLDVEKILAAEEISGMEMEAA